MGLCYGGGFWAATLALVLPLPGDYFPLEGPGVIGQQESVGGEAGHSLLTAVLFYMAMTLFVHQALLDFLRRREGVFQIVRQLLAGNLVFGDPHRAIDC